MGQSSSAQARIHSMARSTGSIFISVMVGGFC